MSEIVSGVLKFTFGFLANKARSKIAERLNHGDVTHEECRRLIVRELDDIKTKLDGLARKDLVSSLLFLQDGVNGIYQSISQFQSSENNTTETTEVEPANSLVRPESSRDTGSDSSSIKDAIALINAVNSLKIHSNKRFISACEKFKLANEKATEAFANDALSIEDRIQASQVRMMARILENLEDPDASVSDCLQYLKQLHDIGAIQGTFSVLIKGGIASWWNESDRLNIASSVILLNQLLFDFAQKFTNLRPILYWPAISFGNGIFHTMFRENRLINKLERFGVKIMSLDPNFTFGEKIYTRCSVVNRKGQIIAASLSKRQTIMIYKTSGESRTLCEVPKVKSVSNWVVVDMDIDAKDYLYIIVAFIKGGDTEWSFELFVFDQKGDKILHCPLPFLSNKFSWSAFIAVNTDGKIAIFNGTSHMLYIGNLSDKFNVDDSFLLNEVSYEAVDIRYLDTKIIAVGMRRGKTCIYTDNGQLEHKLKIPKVYSVDFSYAYSVAINYVTKHILIKSRENKLFRFSETGELIDHLCLGSREWLKFARLVSHPNGAVALVGEREVAFLQL